MRLNANLADYFWPFFFLNYRQNWKWKWQNTELVWFEKKLFEFHTSKAKIIHFVQPFEKSLHLSMLQDPRFDLCSMSSQARSKENSTNSKITNQRQWYDSLLSQLNSSKHININFPSVCWAFFKTCVLSWSSSGKTRAGKRERKSKLFIVIT